MRFRDIDRLYRPQVQILGFLLIVGITFGLWNYNQKRQMYNETYSYAETLAARVYGNRDGELDVSEKRLWHRDMGVVKGSAPSIRSLNEFVSLKNHNYNPNYNLDDMLAN
ncbi:hypothetical protein J4218_06000 [Candidatus Pacearchaeota archaeon]|nr:hypothetical protein [Candidatus Pacearchaeota archaeon]